jgi:hypothetical protein
MTTSQSASARPRWWEKTVEYAFVLRCLPEAASIAPLAGKEETAYGDAHVQLDGQYLLIEFKARHTDAPSEARKFARGAGISDEEVSAQEALNILKQGLSELAKLPQCKAHLLVFGFDDEKSGLALGAVQYTNLTGNLLPATPLTKEAVAALPKVPRVEMATYLNRLQELRGTELPAGGSTVVGLNAEGFSMMTVGEFLTGEPSSEPAHVPPPQVESKAPTQRMKI